MHARRLLALLLTAAILLEGVIALPAPAAAIQPDAYPGKTKAITDFESDSTINSTYGSWTLTPWGGSVGDILTHCLGAPAYNGSKAMQLNAYNSVPPGVRGFVGWQYEWSSDLSIPALRLQTISFRYRLDTQDPGNWTTTADIYGWTEDANGTDLKTMEFSMVPDASWHEALLDDIYVNGSVSVHFWILFGRVDRGWVNVSLDHVIAESQPSNIRFSFFNSYTGLGLNSEILVPSIVWNGQAIRVWNNEVTVAAGETVAYAVTDYFGRLLTAGFLFLEPGDFYIDVPVPLVNVFISRPQWYNSSLPPEWDITCLQNGQSVHAEGWELQLIAGWYRFEWPQTQTSAAGKLDLSVQGNVSARSSYSMQDFSLVLQPSYTSSGGGKTIDPSKWMINTTAFLDLFAELGSTSWFKAAIFVVGAVTVIGFIYGAMRWSAKRVKKGLRK